MNTLASFWPPRKVAMFYKIFRDGDRISERATIVLDENQKIYFIKVYPIAELPDIQEILNTLRNMP